LARSVILCHLLEAVADGLGDIAPGEVPLVFFVNEAVGFPGDGPAHFKQAHQIKEMISKSAPCSGWN